MTLRHHVGVAGGPVGPVGAARRARAGLTTFAPEHRHLVGAPVGEPSSGAED